jgi:hypothetical protein
MEVENTKNEENNDVKIEVIEDGDTQIEVVDDSPPKPSKYKKMEETPEDANDDELSQYGEKVRKRIQHFQKGYHEARREADTALKEREAAILAAQKVLEENKKLKGSLNENQNSLLEQAKRVVAVELESTRKKYKEAHESGEADKMIEANEELAAAKVKFDRVTNYKPTTLQEDESVVQLPELRPIVPRDEKAESWREENPWFGVDDEMTSLALAYHKKLISEGANPKSEEYYEKINARMRKRFPENFEPTESDDDEVEEKPTKESRPKTNANVVAPATRSSAPKKVRLTQSQLNIAKRLGVPIELYARKVAEQEMRK